MDAQALEYTILRLIERHHNRRGGPRLVQDVEIAAATGAELADR
jgi:hypothetical protein